MSGPKKWVSSKVHRKTSSRSNISSHLSGLSLVDEGLIPSPPTRLPDEDGTPATAIVDFGSGGSTLTSQRCDGGTGGASIEWSNSSIDSASTGLTQSPSTTPPKKVWETNYKSFLKKAGKSSHAPIQVRMVPIKPSMRNHPNYHQKRSESKSHNLLSNAIHNQSFPSSQRHSNDIFGEDSRPSLADGFEAHSQIKTPSEESLSKSKEAATRGGAFFKRWHSSSNSGGNLNLDGTMRRGVDRKSPSNTPMNTPPGSAVSTPRKRVLTMPERVEEAPTHVLVPILAPPNSLGHQQDHQRVLSQGGTAYCNSLDRARHLGSSVSVAPPESLPQNGSAPILFSRAQSVASMSLDQTRHCGSSVSAAPPEVLPQKGTAPVFFSRAQSVASMASNHIIPEGGPTAVNNDDDEHIRDRRKAFTDFHNMGVDSSSAYLGDELSLHKNSVFLSSVAYPAGSAGRKARQTFDGGSRSLDQKRKNVSPSTSLNSISETKSQRTDSKAEILPEPERSLCSLKGPEQWTKGERRAIIPGLLCMCPIQVLNSIMSKEEGFSQRPSLTSSRGSQRGFGIGSILSQDESGDSNGWFFADHHQPTAAAGTVPFHSGSNSVPSAFGKILLGKATVALIGMHSFLNELYGWCTGVFILRQNYLFEYREGDSQNGLPWGYAHLPFAEAYPHKHFMNALHLDFFERPCFKSGKRSLLLRVEDKNERDRWVSLLQAASRMTMHDLYDVDESDGALIFGEGRYAKVRPATRKNRPRSMSFSGSRLQATTSHESLWNVASNDGVGGCNKSSNDLKSAMVEYQCALKIIDKKEFWTRVKKGRERADTLVRETAVQTTLAVLGAETSGFLRLLNIFETGEHLVLELELLNGTDLFQHISSRGVLDEVEAAHITRDLLNCLTVLDKIGIAHRDIKPANLLMCHEENNNGSKIKLADYGMASFVGVDNLVRGRCGTPGFVAPEILLTHVDGGYGNKVDVFSAGVTLYVMLAGYEPFYGESDEELIKANREAKVDFPHADWHTVSVEGRDLLEKMLTVDPSKRIGPSEALRHPWITRRVPSRSNEDFCNQPLCSIF